MTAPPSNLTRLYYNGSAAKSHSTTTQYHQLRRLNSRCCPSSCLLAVVAMLFALLLPRSGTVPLVCFNYQNNSASSPGFLGQRFNNLKPGCTFDVILTSLVQYNKILSKFGQQELVMVNYACGFNQLETGKYFERMKD